MILKQTEMTVVGTAHTPSTSLAQSCSYSYRSGTMITNLLYHTHTTQTTSSARPPPFISNSCRPSPNVLAITILMIRTTAQLQEQFILRQLLRSRRRSRVHAVIRRPCIFAVMLLDSLRPSALANSLVRGSFLFSDLTTISPLAAFKILPRVGVIGAGEPEAAFLAAIFGVGPRVNGAVVSADRVTF